MIPNNQSSVSTSGARAQIPPDTYKNNILKAKTYDENKIAPTASVSSGVSSANERMQRWVARDYSTHPQLKHILHFVTFYYSTNLNLTGDSPPPKEVPDMSSATFVSVVSVDVFYLKIVLAVCVLVSVCCLHVSASSTYFAVCQFREVTSSPCPLVTWRPSL